MKREVTAKVIARGKYRKNPVTIEVLRYGGGLDENDDWQDGNIEVLRNVVNFRKLFYSDKVLSKSDTDSIEHLRNLEHSIVKRYLKSMKFTHAYSAKPRTIEAYWLAFHYGDGFDEVPEITVEGNIYTFGAPFSDENTSGVVF